MFLLDETGRFLYTKYGKSEEGVQTLGEKIIHGIHRFLEILEIVLAAIIVLVLVALMGNDGLLCNAHLCRRHH